MHKSVNNLFLLFIFALINGDVLYYYLKELLNGEDNCYLLDPTIKNKNYWFIKVYSIITIYLSFYLFNSLKIEWYLIYVMFSGLIIIFYYDYLERIIPNDLVFSLLIVFLINGLITGNYGMNILWGTVPTLIFLAIAIAVPGSVGMGDIKLLFVLGLIFSLIETMWIINISSITAILFYVFEKLVLSKEKDKTLAYGPYIMLGGLIVGTMF
jgi:Flp pilus assembly protein protease CpaA